MATLALVLPGCQTPRAGPPAANALDHFDEARRLYRVDQPEDAFEQMRNGLGTPLRFEAGDSAAPEQELLALIREVAEATLAYSDSLSRQGSVERAILAARFAQRLGRQLAGVEPPRADALRLATWLELRGDDAEAAALARAGRRHDAAKVTARLRARRDFAGKRVIPYLEAPSTDPRVASVQLRTVRDDWRLRAPGR